MRMKIVKMWSAAKDAASYLEQALNEQAGVVFESAVSSAQSWALSLSGSEEQT